MEVLQAKPVRAVLGAGAALLLWLIFSVTLPHGAPAGIILAGVVFGAINSLVAVSIVLVYRANRVINFAAAEFGSVAAVTAIEMHIKLHTNYFLAIGAGLVGSALLGGLIEVIILRRFYQAPRMIVNVVTIALAVILDAFAVIIPAEWSNGNNAGTFTTPWNLHFAIFPVLFNGNYIVAIIAVPVVLGALAWFLRGTSYGVAIRAAADNGDRARLMGIPVARLSTIVWTIAGFASALAVLLRVPIQGFSSLASVSGGGPNLLLETLTAAVLAGMTSLPIAFGAAVGLGVADQLSAWTFRNATYVDILLFVIIVVALLVRREKFNRSADTGIGTWQAIQPVRPVPAELVSLPEVRYGARAVRLILLAFVIALPWWITPARSQLASVIIVYAIVAVALVILTGWSNQISLGHMAFMGLGAAVAGNLFAEHGWDLFLALLAGAAVSGVMALLIGIPALRITGPYLAVVTLGLVVVSYNYFLVHQNVSWLAPSVSTFIDRAPLFGRIAISSDRQMYYFCLVVGILVLVAARTLRASHGGRAMVASYNNRLATESVGLSTTRLFLMSFVVSGAIAGLAGGLLVVQQEAFNFGTYDPQDSTYFFLMVVLGGLGSIPGAVLGAVAFYGSQYFLPEGWGVFVPSFGVLLVLMFFPGGIGAVIYQVRDYLLRRVADRRGILVPSLVADRLVEANTIREDAADLIAHGLAVAPSGANGSSNGATTRTRTRARPVQKDPTVELEVVANGAPARKVGARKTPAKAGASKAPAKKAPARIRS